MIKLSVSVPEINQSYTHIVTTSAHSARHVRAQAGVEEGFTYFRVLHFAIHVHIHKVSHLLIRMAFPDTVTAHENEIYFRE